MSLEYENSLLTLNQMVFEDIAQNMVEGDIIIPDVKPDIISVIHKDAKVKVISKDGMVVRGIIKFNILYMSDDPSRFISSIDHSINFEQQIDGLKETGDIRSYVDSMVDHIDCTILNGRKLKVNAIISTKVRMFQLKDIEAVSNISNAEIMTKNICIDNEIENDPIETVLSYQSEIPFGMPAIREIIRTDATIKNKEIKLTGNKIIISGDIDIRSLYIPDDDEFVNFVSNEYSFSEVFDTPNISDDFDLIMNIEEVRMQIQQDDDGDNRVINYDIFISINLKSTEKQYLDIVSDAYSTSSKLDFEKATIKSEGTVGDLKNQVSMKEVIRLSPEAVPKDIYNTILRPIISDIQIQNDKVVIEGICESNIIYLSDNDKPLQSYKQDIPFSQVVEMKGINPSMKPQAYIEVSNSSSEIINNIEVDLKIVMTISLKVKDQQYYDAITKVDEIPLDNNKIFPSMVVYYVQTGDTLWGIAKRYYTTVPELLGINKIDSPEAIFIGQQLLIPRV